MASLRNTFLHYLAQTSDAPPLLEIQEAQDLYLYDLEGKAYLDLIAGISVSTLGHQHPEVVKAVTEQAGRHMHVMVYGELAQAPQVKLAEKLVQTLPDPLDNVYFVNSGSEAVEGALKLAKRYTGRTNIVAFHDAYHGASHGALSVTGNEPLKRNFRPLLPGINHIPLGDHSSLRHITSDTAAAIIEPVQGEAGVRIPTNDFLHKLRERCNETGTLLIFDESQTGYGRTGTLWRFTQTGIQPDILVAAKGMGGGMPLGCFIAPKDIMHVFTHNPVLGHITTFGGHPLSAAASLATLEVLERQRLPENVASKEKAFTDQLNHPSVLEIRSAGLMMAVELGSFEKVRKFTQIALENGILTDWFVFCDTAFRIAPPLTITEATISSICGQINALLDTI